MQAQKDNIIYTDALGIDLNGSGVRIDGTLRELKVVLCEAKYLALATASANRKPVHCDFHYLEQYKFKLVKGVLKYCEVLLKNSLYFISSCMFFFTVCKIFSSSIDDSNRYVLYDSLARKTLLTNHKIYCYLTLCKAKV